MRKLPALLVAAALLPAPATAQLWKCEIKGVYKPNGAGHLTALDKPRSWDGAEIGDSLFYDESSGIVRIVNKKLNATAWELKFQPWQRGNKENSAVGVYLKQGPSMNPAMLLRITAWEKPFRLTFDDEYGNILTGLCEVLTPRG